MIMVLILLPDKTSADAINKVRFAITLPDEELVSKNNVLQLIRETGGCDAKEPWAKGFDSACDTLYNAVRSMKPEEMLFSGSDTEWIPASKPPKDCRDVLICYANGDQDVAYREAGRWWLGKFFTDTVDDADVAAWRQLPRPYHEEK